MSSSLIPLSYDDDGVLDDQEYAMAAGEDEITVTTLDISTDMQPVEMTIENLGDELYKQHGSGIYEPGRRLILEVDARWP